MIARLTAPLREAPATVPAFGALALMVVWATRPGRLPPDPLGARRPDRAGAAGDRAAAVRPRLGEIPPAVRLAVACLAAYTALSFLSILWAGVPGDAWEGANRTLLYLLVFALFACWAQTGATAALLVCAWTVALTGVALFTVLHVDAAAGHAARLLALLPGGRLVYPAGYVNANAAQWLMAPGRRCCWRASGGCRGAAGGAGGRRGGARRGGAAQPEPGLGVRDGGDGGAGVRAAAGPGAHVRASGPGGRGDRRGGAGGAAGRRPGERAGRRPDKRRPRRGCARRHGGGSTQCDGGGARGRGGDTALRARGRRGGGGGGGA